MKLKNGSIAKNKKGFSLVELMVVVAIIGVLAVIGIPQYQKFMSKARQSEAKTHLNAIFQGEAAFFTEYNSYTGNLSVIGAGAVGQRLRYNAGFVTLCTGETALSPAGAAANNSIIDVSTGGATWHWIVEGNTVVDTANGAILCTNVAYEAGAWGNPTNIMAAGSNNADLFSMNQTRLLRQITVGM